ncbi:MAG: DNA alkylation repair protein [Clostridia bacterium]|nr:DNA alkylation repair protein [Clostridia bacterium]
MVIQDELFRLQDPKYRSFQCKLIPTADPETIIGVRTPELRKLAKQLKGTAVADCFLHSLPHVFFDENQLHAFLLSYMRDYTSCLEAVQIFLPFVDNWATCDQLSPGVFRKNRETLLAPVRKWIDSGKTYPVRFGIGMLMQHYLDDRFDPSFPEIVASVHSEEYYVRMMIAWYFATALAKQYTAIVPFLEKFRLDPWVHNKAIQKATESYRISSEQKDYLRTLKRKGTR